MLSTSNRLCNVCGSTCADITRSNINVMDRIYFEQINLFSPLFARTWKSSTFPITGSPVGLHGSARPGDSCAKWIWTLNNSCKMIYGTSRGAERRWNDWHDIIGETSWADFLHFEDWEIISMEFLRSWLSMPFFRFTVHTSYNIFVGCASHLFQLDLTDMFDESTDILATVCAVLHKLRNPTMATKLRWHTSLKEIFSNETRRSSSFQNFARYNEIRPFVEYFGESVIDDLLPNSAHDQKVDFLHSKLGDLDYITK